MIEARNCHPRLMLTLAFLVFSGGVSHAQERLPFSHEAHVDKLWPSFFFEEVWRDCQGCHSLDTSGPPPHDFKREIGNVCQSCHQAEVKPTKEQFADLAASESGKHLNYYHGDHVWGTKYTTLDGKPDTLECKTCHQPEGDSVPDLIDRPVPDRDFCLKCHAESSGSDQFDPKFMGKLRTRVQSGGTTQSRFAHSRTHMKKSCNFCHSEMPRAGAGDFADYMFDEQSCYTSGCHTREQLQLVTGTTQRETQSRGTFIHKKHLSAKAIQQDARLGDCAFCHDIDPKTGKAQLSPRFQQDVPRGEIGPGGCVECHADVSPPDHGNVGACEDCHRLDFGSSVTWKSLKDHRPKLEAPRPRASQFSTRSHSHVFLGETPEKECATCHVAALPETPSRFPERAFDHTVHLGETPSSEECMACHEGIATSSDLKYYRASHEGEVLLNYDRQECESCHPGRQPEPQFAPEMREVLDFNHRDHRNAFECIHCHTLPAEGEAGGAIGLPAKVASCSGSECHGHSVDQAKRVGTLHQQQLDNCRFCHDNFPIPGKVMTVERKAVLEASGMSAKHTPDADCSECHARRAQDPDRMASNGGILNPHASIDLRTYQIPGGVNCIDCHWGRSDRPRQQGRSGWQQEPYGQDGLEMDIRKTYGRKKTVGDAKTAFPGFRFKPRR